MKIFPTLHRSGSCHSVNKGALTTALELVEMLDDDDITIIFIMSLAPDSCAAVIAQSIAHLA